LRCEEWCSSADQEQLVVQLRTWYHISITNASKGVSFERYKLAQQCADLIRELHNMAHIWLGTKA
jgi:hypothetical protein